MLCQIKKLKKKWFNNEICKLVCKVFFFFLGDPSTILVVHNIMFWSVLQSHLESINWVPHLYSLSRHYFHSMWDFTIPHFPHGYPSCGTFNTPIYRLVRRGLLLTYMAYLDTIFIRCGTSTCPIFSHGYPPCGTFNTPLYLGVTTPPFTLKATCLEESGFFMSLTQPYKTGL